MKRYLLMTILIAILSTPIFGQTASNLNNTYWHAIVSGNTKLMLKLELKGNKFIFTSRKGSSRNLLKSKYFIGKMLGKVNPHTIEIKGTYTFRNDSIYLNGEYQSLTSTQNFKGTIVNDVLNATLTKNSIVGKRTDSFAPLRDYYAIARSAIDTTEKYLFNPEILNTKKWTDFKNNTLKLSKVVCDDYEFEKLYRLNSRNLPFTHYGISIVKQGNNAKESAKSGSKEKQTTKFEIRKVNNETVLFTVHTFSASAAEIIPYIDSLKHMHFSNLIVDLRNNPGGTIASALPLASYLVNDTLYGGVFLTQKYFNKHTDLPEVSSYKNFPIFSEASFPLIIDGIHKQKGLCLIVSPDDITFKGDLYILTNRGTGSTGEPLVYGLKASKRATIVGERTYGGMMNGERFSLGNEFSLWMPTADYYAADGFKIDKVGVEPDIKVDAAKALEKTLEIIYIARNKQEHCPVKN